MLLALSQKLHKAYLRLDDRGINLSIYRLLLVAQLTNAHTLNNITWHKLAHDVVVATTKVAVKLVEGAVDTIATKELGEGLTVNIEVVNQHTVHIKE
jgi:hypothetical protein